jgi:hypothetical protein
MQALNTLQFFATPFLIDTGVLPVIHAQHAQATAPVQFFGPSLDPSGVAAAF